MLCSGMSRTMIISSCPAPATTVRTSAESFPSPAKISAYMSATRSGVVATPGRDGSSPMPLRIKRTPSTTSSRSNPGGGSRSLIGDELVEHVGEAGETRKLCRSRHVATLAEAVDPYSGDPELRRRGDVVEQARRHVDVPIGARLRSFPEYVPVSVSGLVRTGIVCGDNQVRLDADVQDRRGEQVRVGVRQDAQPPPSRSDLLQRASHLRKGRPGRK